ncbi:MAG: DNA polymerase IV [Proteobacteria bacterium]|nr:MAG: DNA polymerase IV [Pseudomonadota bacterium]
MARAILHADMDAFFAAVEQHDDPSLRGKPLVVGGEAPRGVVAAASYEARVYGIHSAMPMIRAQQRCPELVRLSPRMARYAEVSRQVFAIFRSYSPLVEGLSLDEAFIDCSASGRLHGSAEEIAKEIKRRVREELSLVVSIGVGPNKMVAKIASDLDKPDGLLVVCADEMLAFLHPLPARRLFGVGKVTERKLAALGIRTVGELAAYPRQTLLSRLGKRVGAHLHDLARGVDDRPVVPDAPPKSLGAEDTFTRDIDDDQELRQIVRRQAELVGERLRARELAAKVVVLKAKSGDHRVKTRRKRLQRPTSDGVVLARAAITLLPSARRALGGAALRLTGVTASELSAHETPKQLSFDEAQHAQGDALARTLDAIAGRFGAAALQRGVQSGDNLLRRRDGRASGGPGEENETCQGGEPRIVALDED